ncbi:hypothetical protein RchiOBHm_Chr6g0255701 [Rosa chinensis]|uniref:Uncharacterized protein n=1 Tax=Rosa chinensis TaxID=74649 RepID=A0A2P6PLX3_ROSCH|nr:hypothetical protein RchiOBHm_Chr6g0255701 [Rosa chinensis]
MTSFPTHLTFNTTTTLFSTLGLTVILETPSSAITISLTSPGFISSSYHGTHVGMKRETSLNAPFCKE